MEKKEDSLVNSSFYGWFVWGLASFFYLYQFVLRASPNVMSQDLMRAFSIQASSLGILSSCYYYAYAFLQIPIGLLLDRVGPQKVLRVATLVCAVGTLLLATAPSFLWACAGRVLVGAGAAGAFLSTISLISLWLKPQYFAFAIGATIALGKMGGVVSNGPLVWLIQAQNWRTALVVLFFVGVGISALVWLFLQHKDCPKKLEQETVSSSIRTITHTPQMWLIAVYGCLMYVPLSVFTDTWGTLFLMKKYTLSKSIASGALSLVFVGTAIGAPLVAFVSDKFKERRGTLLLSALSSLITAVLLVFWPQTETYTAFILCFLFGITMTGQTLVFTCASERMPAKISGLATGFTNTVVMLGGVFLQPLAGFILDFLWDGEVRGGVPFYSLENFQLSLAVIPISVLISLVLALCIKETFKDRSSSF